MILRYKMHADLDIFQEKGVLCTRKYSTYFQRDTELYNISNVRELKKNTVCQSRVSYPHSPYHKNFDIALLNLSIHKNDKNNFTLKLIGILNIHFQLLLYILESNPHPFYSFRGLKNQTWIRIARGLDSRSRARFWKNDRAAVRAVRTIQQFIIYNIIYY